MARWSEHLDALEAWVALVERTVSGSPLPLPDPPEPPPGELPEEHRLRARALLARMTAVSAAGGRRRTALGRARAYDVDPGD